MIWKGKEHRIAKTALRKSTVGGTTIPNPKDIAGQYNFSLSGTVATD